MSGDEPQLVRRNRRRQGRPQRICVLVMSPVTLLAACGGADVSAGGNHARVREVPWSPSHAGPGVRGVRLVYGAAPCQLPRTDARVRESTKSVAIPLLGKAPGSRPCVASIVVHCAVVRTPTAV